MEQPTQHVPILVLASKTVPDVRGDSSIDDDIGFLRISSRLKPLQSKESLAIVEVVYKLLELRSKTRQLEILLGNLGERNTFLYLLCQSLQHL